MYEQTCRVAAACLYTFPAPGTATPDRLGTAPGRRAVPGVRGAKRLEALQHAERTQRLAPKSFALVPATGGCGCNGARDTIRGPFARAALDQGRTQENNPRRYPS
jgi:hypothetical protein